MAATTIKTSERFFERVAGPPIPPVEANMEKFTAGAVSIGVEFRLLTDEFVGLLGLTEAAQSNNYFNLDDRGVSIHVFVKAADGDLERLRFDCFQDDPHYHYFFWNTGLLDIIHMDPTAIGDPLAWTIERIRARLPQLLQRVGVENALQLVDFAALDAIMPMVTEAAYRARFKADKDHIRQGALAKFSAGATAAPAA